NAAYADHIMVGEGIGELGLLRIQNRLGALPAHRSLLEGTAALGRRVSAAASPAGVADPPHSPYSHASPPTVPATAAGISAAVVRSVVAHRHLRRHFLRPRRFVEQFLHFFGVPLGRGFLVPKIGGIEPPEAGKAGAGEQQYAPAAQTPPIIF